MNTKDSKKTVNALEKHQVNKSTHNLLLREQVYSYLKSLLNDRQIKPGTALDLKSLCENLGFSRTPLRDALLRLEAEGFVTIHSRRGVLVAPLDLDTIRNSYQIIGALESAAILEAENRFDLSAAHKMLELNERMRLSLKNGDFDSYYNDNLSFHDCYLSQSKNEELKRTVKILKERLYDFPRQETFISNWELDSVNEHDELVKLFLKGSIKEAAFLVRDVHWSYSAQENYIIEYYFRQNKS